MAVTLSYFWSFIMDALLCSYVPYYLTLFLFILFYFILNLVYTIITTPFQTKSITNLICFKFKFQTGGYGTLEELLEIITWAQLGIHDKPVRLQDIPLFEEVKVKDILLWWLKLKKEITYIMHISIKMGIKCKIGNNNNNNKLTK